MTRELLKRALDALDNPMNFRKVFDAKAALRAALTQPEPEPVAWMREGWGPDCGPYTEIYTEAEMTWRDRKQWTPLYATPPAIDGFGGNIDAAFDAPSGMVMVPREPTEDMIQAAAEAWDATPGMWDAFKAAIKASIAAAPAPAAPAAPAVPDGAIPPGSWEHLKVMMQHSAWEDTLQLCDALANIDDFAKSAAPAVPLTKDLLQRHAMFAADAPPSSAVVLLSSLHRLLGITGGSK